MVGISFIEKVNVFFEKVILEQRKFGSWLVIGISGGTFQAKETAWAMTVR